MIVGHQSAKTAIVYQPAIIDANFDSFRQHTATQLERLLAHFGAADACWFSSTRPDGRPHLAPIWHVVHADCIYVVTRRTAVRAANIRANAAVSLALADTSNALIVEGVAHPAAEMREALRPLFLAKYDWDIATDAEYDDVIQVDAAQSTHLGQPRRRSLDRRGAVNYPVDLQLHSTASDGTDTPAALVALCAARGVRVVALTDHDAVLGVDEAIAAGRQYDVQVIPALEFSTRSEPARDLLDINILAMGIRHQDIGLLATLERVLASRIEQKIRQIERLQAYGVAIEVGAVLARAQGVPGRVHIAQEALARNPQQFTSVADVFAQFLAPDAPNSTYVSAPSA
jgi:hypothetical protein